MQTMSDFILGRLRLWSFQGGPQRQRERERPREAEKSRMQCPPGSCDWRAWLKRINPAP